MKTESHKDLVINALFEKIRPILLILGAHPHYGDPRQRTHLTANKALSAGQGDLWKRNHIREEHEELKSFKDT